MLLKFVPSLKFSDVGAKTRKFKNSQNVSWLKNKMQRMQVKKLTSLKGCEILNTITKILNT